MTYWDDKLERYRIVVGYVGEGLKALTWYRLSDAHEFEEVNG